MMCQCGGNSTLCICKCWSCGENPCTCLYKQFSGWAPVGISDADVERIAKRVVELLKEETK